MEDILYSNDNFKILCHSINKNIFTIEFSNPNPILIDSLVKSRIIRGGTITDDYTLLTLKAQTVKSFQQFQEQYYKMSNCKRFSINTISNMVDSLTTQLNYLLKNKSSTFLGYNIENLIVIDDEKFIFLDSELLTEISRDTNQILISFPFKKTDFFVSPELLKISEIPSYVHFKTTYFSLGCLLLYALTSEYDFYHEYLQHPNNKNNNQNNVNNNQNNVNNNPNEKIEKCLNLHPIRYTKLYWLIERCLVEEPENRSILFI